MKNTFWQWAIAATMVFAGNLKAQEIIKTPGAFEKIVVSPKINVILVKGTTENVRIVYSNISPEKIHARVEGKTLHLFLDKSRVLEKRESVYRNNHKSRLGVYRNTAVTAYVTYNQLHRLEVRGEEEVQLDSVSVDKKFKLKAYGESEITIASINTNKFKASLYGRNKLKVKGGKVNHQTYRCYGENKVDSRAMECDFATSRLYGEDKLFIQAKNELRISAIGEPQIQLTGSPDVRRGIVIGRLSFNHNDPSH